jgi:hypothetical protein
MSFDTSVDEDATNCLISANDKRMNDTDFVNYGVIQNEEGEERPPVASYIEEEEEER